MKGVVVIWAPERLVQACQLTLSLSLGLCTLAASASETSFSGTWSIDLRSAEQKRQNVECGHALFVLLQKGSSISGTHSMSTPGCARLNEDGSVLGSASGGSATLVVTSGRNGAVVEGVAELKGANKLRWRTTRELKVGEPDGDSPLILSEGVLVRGAR